MKKKQLIIVIFILFILFFLVFLFFNNKQENTEDAKKFKEEYEAYNGLKTEDDEVYPTVDVNKKNVMYYATSKEILTVLKEGTGVIYFGTPEDPWSRNAVNVLLQASEATALRRIYYLDLSKKYDIYEIKNKKAEKIKEASASYYEMVKLLDPYLNAYLLYDGEKTIDTGVKRIFMPFVIFVQEGKIISTREGTTSSHINNGNGFIKLTNSEQEELFNYYVDKMTIILDTSCNETC